MVSPDIVSDRLVTGTDTGALTFYDIYQVSADYQITPKLRIGALYGQIKAKSGVDKDADGWSIAGYYDIWRDTIVYTIVDQIKKSIPREQWQRMQSASDGEIKRFADEIAKANVRRVLQDILAESRTIKRLVDEGRIVLAGAIYDVNSAEIEFLLDDAIGLRNAE